MPSIHRAGTAINTVPSSPSPPPMVDTPYQTYSSSLGMVSRVFELDCMGRESPAMPVRKNVSNSGTS